MKLFRSMVCAAALAALGTVGVLTAGCASDYRHHHYDRGHDHDHGDHHDDHPGPG